MNAARGGLAAYVISETYAMVVAQSRLQIPFLPRKRVVRAWL